MISRPTATRHHVSHHHLFHQPTSNTPPSMQSTLTSNVPPPRSKITTLDPLMAESSFLPWRPYASAAAVGSLMIRRTSRPWIVKRSGETGDILTVGRYCWP